MANKRKRLLIIIGALVIGIIGIFGIFEYTSQPNFCTSCHEISPYVKSWKTSIHSHVNCLKCHAEPGAIGKYKRKIYSVKEIVGHIQGKAPGGVPTQIPNKNCLQAGCHMETKLLESEKFNHKFHLANKDVNCIHCHRGVGHSQTKANTKLKETHKVCLKCHD